MLGSINQRFSRTDWGIVLIVLMLLIVGLVMVYSASYGFALYEGGDYQDQPTFFVTRQAKFVAAGLVLMMVLWRVDYHLYKRFAIPILAATMLVLAVMATIGRWVLEEQQSIQPVEAAKIGALIYIAVWLEAKQQGIRSHDLRQITSGLIPFALLLGIIAGFIVAQPDFSTAALLVVTAATMFFVAGADLKQIIIGFLVGSVSLILVAMIARYRVDRFAIWVDGPFRDALGKGYQIVQTLKAVNSGSWLGVGLGQSQQKFTIFAPHTDCVYAIIAEELGFVGATIIIGMYGLWTWRGFRIARYAQDTYGTLLAIGIVAWVALQAGLHISVMTATTPFTGTVLPFVSYGGSSMIAGLGSVGILLNISRSSHIPGAPRA